MANQYSFEIQGSSIGLILDKKVGHPVGTGFVVGNQQYVATCSHVILDNSSYEYWPAGSSKGFPLIVHKNFPEYDLAFLGFENTKPMGLQVSEFGDIRSMRPGSLIAYIGWESESNALKVDSAKIHSCGSELRGDMTIEYIEFQGVAKPGYSGGPVYDFLTGKIIAMVSEGGYYMGYNSTNKVLINRAFSIEILKIADRYY